MENIIEINFKVGFTDQDIDDIVCTAFEGGINYWCEKVEVVGDLLGEYASDQISRGGQLKIFDSEDFIEEECVILDKEKLIKGIKLYVSNSSTNILVQDRKQGLIIDTCQVDAEVADCIIQYALFDEIVFG